MTSADSTVNVRYMVDDVQTAVDFYVTHLGFTQNTNYAPAFADVTRGNLRLLLSGPATSAGRCLTAAYPRPVDGTGSTSSSMTSRLRPSDCALPVSYSAMTSSPGQAASRRCPTTQPATRSNCSSPPSPDWTPSRRRHPAVSRAGPGS